MKSNPEKHITDTHNVENSSSNTTKKFSLAMVLVTIGVVYGDVGTSPMYVMKSILAGNGGIGNVNEEFIIGSLSLVIWTITLLTTVKFVMIALKAENHGEGGIFALFSLVKNYGKWLIIPAMIGGATLLADGVLTPAVTVTTAVEGLRSIPFFDGFLGEGQVIVVIVTIAILILLFSVQHAGTSKIGAAFGPIMLLWFAFLGVSGVTHIFSNLNVLKAFNPIYAVKVLLSPYNKCGIMILGSVFLATTGAEALYSDMGHVGKVNIYVSWPFVKLCLILNYLGQGAWIIENSSNAALAKSGDPNPFYLMLPEVVRPFAIILGAAAAIIASQALITGSFTLVTDAIRLDLMPHLRICYPSDTKGQMYIPLVNSFLGIGCILFVAGFQSGSRLEAAYGLSITITMIATTLLLAIFLYKVKSKKISAILVGIVFGVIEIVFFVSSLDKFAKGGYVAVLLALLLFAIMFIWYRGTQIEEAQKVKLRFKDFIPSLTALHNDEKIQKKAFNMVFIIKDNDPEFLDRDVLYSILDKDTKRADAYWFINVNVTDIPNEMTYSVENYGTNFLFRVQLNLGYKVPQTINVYLRQIVTEMIESGELPAQNPVHSIYAPSKIGNFKFCMIKKVLKEDGSLSGIDKCIMLSKYAIRRSLGSPLKWYGIDTASSIIEYVPLFIENKKQSQQICRI